MPRADAAPRLADLHCHILPGIDDGARDLDDSIEMARQAQADGIATVCATPHIRHDHDVRIEELVERVAEVQAAVAAAGVAVSIASGGEVAETALHGLTETELDAVSLGTARTWILLEPAPGPLGPTLVDSVDHLAAAGRRAVIAHPERHLGAGAEDALEAVVGRRALVQATAAHLTDEAGAGPMLLALAARGLIHLVASDAHSAAFGRPVAITAALERLPVGLRPFAAHAPAAILRGEDFDSPQPPATDGSA